MEQPEEQCRQRLLQGQQSMTLFPHSSPRKNRMLLRQFQVSILRESKFSLFKITDRLTYEAEFFVDFII